MSGRLVVALTNCPPSLVPDLSAGCVAVQPFAVGTGLVDVLLFLAEAPVERYDYAAYGGPAGATGELAPVVDGVGVLRLAFVVRRQAVARRRQVAGIGLPAGQGRQHVAQAFVEPWQSPRSIRS